MNREAHSEQDNAPGSLADAAAAEKQAARHVELAGSGAVVAVGIVAVLAYLVLPHGGGVAGWEVLAGRVSLMEQFFAVMSTAGAVLSLAAVLTRRTALVWVAWMCVAIGFFSGLWALWALGTRDASAGIGFYLAALGQLVSFVGFARIALRRSPEQQAAAELAYQRAREEQGSAAMYTVANAAENPLLQDDRRAQAARRHDKRGEV